MAMLVGVGLLLFAQDTGRMLVLKELKAKEHIKKKVGMLSFPLETVKSGESKANAINRLLHEEVGINQGPLLIHPIFFGGTMEILTAIAYTLPAYAVCATEFVAQPGDDDIEFYGWLEPGELLDLFVRVEVGPTLEIFLSKERFGVP